MSDDLTPQVLTPDTDPDTEVSFASHRQVLEETFQYYHKSPRRRAYDSWATSCYYWLDGKVCAVGRLLMDPKSVQENLENPTTGVLSLLATLGRQVLWPQYRKLNENFLKALQLFHDNNGNWTEGGISSRGRMVLDELRTIADELDCTGKSDRLKLCPF